MQVVLSRAFPPNTPYCEVARGKVVIGAVFVSGSMLLNHRGIYTYRNLGGMHAAGSDGTERNNPTLSPLIPRPRRNAAI